MAMASNIINEEEGITVRSLKNDRQELNDSGISVEDTFQVDWRKSRQKLQDKVQFIFNNVDNAIPRDVTFIIRKDKDDVETTMFAHSFILALSSSVFQEYFTNNYKETHLVHLPNHHPTAVNRFLKFFYFDQVDLEELNAAEILSVLELGIKYENSNAVESCVSILHALITLENAIHILNFIEKARDFGTEGVSCFSECFNFILRNATEILESESILQISDSNFCAILQSDQLDASEATIFNAVLRWGRRKCIDDENVLANPTQIRAKLANIICHIRFPLMTPDEFMSSIAGKGILTRDEKSEILQYISVSEELKQNFVPSTFSCRARIRNSQPLQRSRICYSIQPNFDDATIKEQASHDPQHFVIKNCRLNLNSFIISYTNLIKQKSRKQIVSFTLENVAFIDYDDKIKKPIMFPNLLSFTLNLTCEPQDEAQISKQLRSGFRRFLFFTKKAKHYPWPSPCSLMWSFKTDVLLSLNGIIFLKVEHSSNSITMNQLVGFPLIIDSWSKNEEIRSLAIAVGNTRCYIPFLKITSVEQLTLHNFGFLRTINPGSYCPNLVELVLHRCNFRAVDVRTIVTSNKLLRRLSVSQATLNGCEMVDENDLPSLLNLALWDCSWDEKFEKNFGKLFPGLVELCIDNRDFGSPLYNIIQNAILKPTLDIMVFTGRIWKDTENPSVTTTLQNVEPFDAFKEMYSKLGIKENKIQHLLSRSVTDEGIEISEDASMIVKQLCDKELVEILFKRFGLNKFYSSIESYYRNSVEHQKNCN